MPTYEEMNEWREEQKRERETRQKELEEIRRREWEKKGVKFEPFDVEQVPPRRCDHPNTIEDSTATVVWLVVMLVGSIFKCNWVIWIVATIVWYKFITRYKK